MTAAVEGDVAGSLMQAKTVDHFSEASESTASGSVSESPISEISKGLTGSLDSPSYSQLPVLPRNLFANEDADANSRSSTSVWLNSAEVAEVTNAIATPMRCPTPLVLWPNNGAMSADISEPKALPPVPMYPAPYVFTKDVPPAPNAPPAMRESESVAAPALSTTPKLGLITVPNAVPLSGLGMPPVGAPSAPPTLTSVSNNEPPSAPPQWHAGVAANFGTSSVWSETPPVVASVVAPRNSAETAFSGLPIASTSPPTITLATAVNSNVPTVNVASAVDFRGSCGSTFVDAAWGPSTAELSYEIERSLNVLGRLLRRPPALPTLPATARYGRVSVSPSVAEALGVEATRAAENAARALGENPVKLALPKFPSHPAYPLTDQALPAKVACAPQA